MPATSPPKLGTNTAPVTASTTKRAGRAGLRQKGELGSRSSTTLATCV
ncbi:hypothetical protein WMF38_08730 [Sorangium sp. So ce118]